MTYTLSFRVKRIYFDRIVAGIKREEYRARTSFWIPRARTASRLIFDDGTVIAVFVCGKDVHRRRVVRIERYSSASDALGREATVDELKMLGTGEVLVFCLGATVTRAELAQVRVGDSVMIPTKNGVVAAKVTAVQRVIP